MLFSIIIPVYNVKDFLHQCITSVLNQTFDDFEVIIVDDGSTDGSSSICDCFAIENPKIKVIHKKNGGLSDARNVGIAEAKGRYLVFVDSDDYIESSSLANMSVALEKNSFPDILVTTLIDTYCDFEECNDRSIDLFFKKRTLSKKHILKWELDYSKDGAPAQKKICKRDLIVTNNISFSNGRLHEDIDWTTKIYYYAKTFGIFSFPWYHHRRGRKGQISGVIHAKNLIDIIEMGQFHYDYYAQNHSKQVYSVLKLYLVRLYRILSKYSLLNEEEKCKVAKCIERNKKLYSVLLAPKIKYKSFALLLKIMGVKKALDCLFN